MSLTPLYNETTLLSEVAKGNENAFRQLFEQYWDTVYGVALAFTKSTAIAEEAVQDVFLKIWLKREQLITVEKFDAYLFTVARNHIYNELRKKITVQSLPDNLLSHHKETADSPAQQLIVKESEQLVDKAVEQLPTQQRLIYHLSRQHGLSQDAISAKLQISRHTVKSHMNKALHFIRSYLKTHSEMGPVLIIYCIIHNA